MSRRRIRWSVTGVPSGSAGTIVETVPPLAVERQAIIDLPLPSWASFAPTAVSVWPPVPLYWLWPMPSLATWPVKSIIKQVLRLVIDALRRTTAGSFTQEPR